MSVSTSVRRKMFLMQLRVNAFQEQEKNFVQKFHAKVETQLQAVDIL